LEVLDMSVWTQLRDHHAEAIGTFTSLRELRLDRLHFSDAMFAKAVAPLRQLTRLTFVESLYNRQITGACLAPLLLPRPASSSSLSPLPAETAAASTELAAATETVTAPPPLTHLVLKLPAIVEKEAAAALLQSLRSLTSLVVNEFSCERRV
jgi:hypothetical protein